MILRPLLAIALAITTCATAAQDNVVNLYSARHYQTDNALYEDFTRETGIKVRLIEGKDAALLERLRAEGANSPADVLILADASRLWKAEQTGLFAPIKSEVLRKAIPPTLRAADNGNGSAWFGFSTRARVIVYDKTRIDPKQIRNYADLARPELRDQVCTRSGSHPYMLSLIGAMSRHLGLEAAQEWANGVVANFARKPRGGDTDQIRAVAIGECGVALANSYYYARLMRSNKKKDQQVIKAATLLWPDQDGAGTHVNISGGGMLATAPHKTQAIKFLEYLASDTAQQIFADGNNEWPAVPTAKTDNPAIAALGPFKRDPLPIADIGAAQVDAVKIIDRAGWR